MRRKTNNIAKIASILENKERPKLSKNKIPIVIIFSFFLLTTSALPVFAATYKPGVSVGQYVKYGNFAGVGPGFETFGDYDSATIQITDVAGNQVTLISTGQFKNGTVTPGNGTVNVWDVSVGTENGSPSTQGPIIASDLNAGDSIPPPDTFNVNSTETRQYLGLSRTVNILSITITTPDYNSSLTYTYDKISGMLLESKSLTTVHGETGPVTSEYSYNVVQTNIFRSTPTNSTQNMIGTYLIFSVIILVIVLAITLLLFRKRH